MVRKVLLPREIDDRLTALTGLVDEVNGVLLYKKQGNSCPIEALFMTGVGNVGHVQASFERMEVVNEFFKRNKLYKFVKFHTHSRGTITKYGRNYARHFSLGDIEGIKKQLKHNKEFIAMLVTPEVKLLSGEDNPELVVVNSFPGYQNRSKRVSHELKVVENDLGYHLSRLRRR